MTDLLERIADRSARVAVLGQGYVGLVVAMRATEAGFDVVGLEVDEVRAERLATGDSYIEDVPDDVLRAALDAGYRPTSQVDDLAGFDVAVISVPTPLRDSLPDLAFVESAARMLATHLRPGALVVLESTTYPGTTEEFVRPLLEAGSGLVAGEDFLLGYSPERIDPGNPAWGLHNTPKIVAGLDAHSLAAVEAFFGAFVQETVPAPGCGEAELAKIIENTFRHVNIALVNEIAIFAHALGVDATAAIDAAASKPFGFMRFTPGPGVGGHCLPIDPTYLSWRVKQHLGEHFRFIELANDINDHMPSYVARRVQRRLNDDALAVRGARITIVGLAYKPNVADWREAPSLPLIESLHDLGAVLTAVDPHVVDDLPLPEGVEVHQALTDALLEASDLVVVVTDHDELDWDLLARHASRVFDTRDRLPAGLEGLTRL